MPERFMINSETVKWKKKKKPTAFHSCFSKIYSQNPCQIQSCASDKKDPPALPGRQGFS